ncbi:hypothetical protein V6N13_015966 [Hibiscus sabdariffa]|uniref:Xylanase inhibitor C-terminal domain-containing protein n=1 Tax=Hibiscus sabdariffa TaxID=183260 RepID=A0ABR2CYX5_9ROSI
MVVSSNLLPFLASLLFFMVSPSIQASFRPKALILHFSKDASTLRYITQIKQRTPLVPIKLTLDVGGDSSWVDCENGYVSSSYKPVPLAPFGTCFDAKSFDSSRARTRSRAAKRGDVEDIWSKLNGAVNNDVLCLGLVDGGLEPTTWIVIGGHQMEDNLVQFDLAASRLGFSSSLLFRQTTCSNFNFTLAA